MSVRKIGIMGGTFNPIHNAHIRMAQMAYEQYKLDEVWFMPSKNPPHKEQEKIISDEHRSRMIQLAIDGIENFSFSDLELRREGTTYTRDTLFECVEKYPDAHFYFIIGGDSLNDFEQWYHPEEISQLCTILAVSRDDMSYTDLEQKGQECSRRFDGDFRPVHMVPLMISSKEIRSCLKTGETITGALPEKVFRYIVLHDLYGTRWHNTKRKEKDLLFCLQSTLRPKRYMHTLGVAYTAANLANCFMDGKDTKRARMAGLLHDCAKYVTDDEIISLCAQYKIKLSETEKKNPALIHGKLGAYWAEHRYGIDDEEICSAIFCHTTGKPNMTMLEKILYIADYIEPHRKMDCSPYSLDKIRKQCFQNLDKGLLMILTNTVKYLQESSQPIDEMTLQTYESYKRKDSKHGKSGK